MPLTESKSEFLLDQTKQADEATEAQTLLQSAEPVCNSTLNCTETLPEWIALYDSTPEAVIVPCVFALIFVVGVSGNILLILSFLRHKTLSTPHNALVVNLASGDLVFLLVSLPLNSVWYTLPYWPFGLTLCKVSVFAESLANAVVITSLTVLSVERCLIVTGKRLGRRRSFLPILLTVIVWLISVAVSIPFLFSANIAARDIVGETYHFCFDYNPSWGKTYKKANVLSRFLYLFCIPLLTIAVVYVIIAVHLLLRAFPLSRSSTRRRGHVRGDTTSASVLDYAPQISLPAIGNRERPCVTSDQGNSIEEEGKEQARCSDDLAKLSSSCVSSKNTVSNIVDSAQASDKLETAAAEGQGSVEAATAVDARVEHPLSSERQTQAPSTTFKTTKSPRPGATASEQPAFSDQGKTEPLITGATFNRPSGKTSAATAEHIHMQTTSRSQQIRHQDTAPSISTEAQGVKCTQPLPASAPSVCEETTLLNCQSQLSSSYTRKLRPQNSVTKRRRLALTVLLLIFAFALCWGPRHVYLLWFHLLPGDYNNFWHVFKIVAFCLSFTNSAVNPLVFYVLDDKFRGFVHQSLCRLCVRKCEETSQARSQEGTKDGHGTQAMTDMRTGGNGKVSYL